jgi:hypothetical protein
MPQMSGMELAEKIRETDQDVILIFCTNLQQFALNGYSVGALGFIVKPIQWYSSYYIRVVFIDRSPAECYNSFRVLWIGIVLLPPRRFKEGSNHSFFVEMLIS